MIGQILRSRYQIVKKIGSGGFGDTYLAEDLDLPGKPKCVVKHLQGNVLEWCRDDYQDSYKNAPLNGKPVLINNTDKIKLLRGGSWISFPLHCRSAFRYRNSPDESHHDYIGLRVVVVLP